MYLFGSKRNSMYSLFQLRRAYQLYTPLLYVYSSRGLTGAVLTPQNNLCPNVISFYLAPAFEAKQEVGQMEVALKKEAP